MQDYIFDYNEYKKRTKKPIKINFSLTIFFVIILLGLCVFLNQTKTSYIEYNFVDVGQFSNYSQASKFAQNLSSQNGAGFIYFDDCYHVFAGFYTSKTDAEKVAKNIVEFYPNATATTISANKFKTKSNLKKAQNIAIKNQINTNENIIESISNLSIELDLNNITTTAFNLKITQIVDEFSSTFKVLNSCLFNDKTKRFDLSKYLTEIKNSLTNIQSASAQELPQKVKYELINIVVNNIRFLNALV